MSHKETCPHCHHPELRRAPAWRLLAVAAAWAFVVVMLFVSALIGPFIMFVVPVIFAFGAAAVGSAHALAFAPPACDRCGKLALAGEPAPAPARAAAPALARAA